MAQPVSNLMQIDITEDARWREVNGVVVEIARVAIVRNIGPVGPNPEDLILNLARASPLPQPGATHPWQPALTLRDREITALGVSMARVMLIYRRDDVAQPPGLLYATRGGSSSEQIETQLDKSGNQITVTHQGKTQGGEIHPFESRSEIQVYWLEQSQFPGDLTRTYTNTVNNGPWALDLAAPARTWRCTDISFDLEDGTRTPPLYRFQASFVFNPDKHDPQVIYIDPETGRPPPGLVVNQGYKTITWYAAVNFNNILP